MKYFFLILILFPLSFHAQQKITLSNKSVVSVLTCAPGSDELYTSFGHNAIRIKDPVNNIDRVYNYGTFDFNTPNFYLKFCRGQLLYKLSSYEYKYFPYEYYKGKRWIKFQNLNFTTKENQKIFDYLEWNALDENKNYKYDFFYDNCATKMYEIIENSIGKLDFDYQQFPKNCTHRNLIHQYLASNSWSKFGIDLALGAVIDKKASLKQYMFLPDYVYSGLKSSSIYDKQLVKKTGFILPDHLLKTERTNFILSPMFLSILLLLITFYPVIFNKNMSILFNTITFVYGFLGLVIFSLWFFTEHSTTKMNMNILWANPLLLSYSFLSVKWKKRISIYGIVCLVSFLIVALIGFQQFDASFYILAICLIIIYLKSLLPFKV